MRTHVPAALLALALAAAPAVTARSAAPAKPAPTRQPVAHARAEKRPPFTLEHVLTLSTFSSLTWSPDGSRLAFIATTPDTAENATNPDLWLVDLARGGEPLRLTRHAKADISPTFSPGGDTLAFVANRGSGDDARPAIWMLSLRGGEPWAFGTFDEGVSEVAWSPDGRWLAYVKTDTLPKHLREWRRKKWDHVVEDERLAYPHVWVAEIATGKHRRLVDGPRYCWNVRWSPDSRSLAFLVSPTGKPDDENLADIGVVPVAGGAVRTLGVIGAPFAWSPDSRRIAWAGGWDRDAHVQKSDLWVAPAAGGTPRNLTAAFDEDATEPRWTPDGRTLLFLSQQRASARVAWVAADGGPVALGPDLEGEAGGLSVAPDGRLAYTLSRAQAPAEVWVGDGAGTAGRPMTAFHAHVARTALGTVSTVTWTSTDGVEVEGVLVRPPGAAPRARARTVVMLHGGPYATRYGVGFNVRAQYLAANGWQVFLPNFRSSGGYGTEFMLRRRADWGGQDWRDVASGVDSLVARGLADPKRLVVTGGSYGGYLTAWAITQTDRFRAACVSAGAVDLPSFYGQSDIQRYRAFELEGPPWVSPDKWARSSPSTHIAAAKTPTLILVGRDDARVPYPQAQQLYRALLGLGVPTELVHYPREGHGVREPRHRADEYTRTLAWFERWAR
jgi:dipeptidyl aminopeptidase/acylaminoacyl peptidase